MRALLVLAVSVFATSAMAQEVAWSGFATIVNPAGKISLSGLDYRRSYVFIGTWAVGDADGTHELHQVYTQPEAISAYLATGQFPDGTVIIKELQEAQTGDFTTGSVGHFSAPLGAFVMVRDTQKRFPGNSLWGEGWGWAQFRADETAAPFTEDFRAECLECHEPARQTGLVYVQGYPMLAVDRE